jgi:hypothetical protein
MSYRLSLLIVAAILYAAVVLRISAFRRDEAWRDRGDNHRLIGLPSGNLRALFSRSSYSQNGQRLIPWLYSAFLFLLIAALIAMPALLAVP